MAEIDASYGSCGPDGSIQFFFTYDDLNGTADIESGPLVGAYGINNSTGYQANVRLTRMSNGQIFTDTLDPGVTKRWRVPNNWGTVTIYDVGVGYGCTRII